MCMVTTKSFAYDLAVKNENGVTICYSYINDGKELAVVQPTSPYSYNIDTIRIPQSVVVNGEELPVTRIEDKAFQNSKVAIIELPDGLKSIGSNAFYGCNLLETIKIPDSVEGKIGDECFYNCVLLSSVQIGENIAEIGSKAFYGCKILKKMILPNKVAIIGAGAFYNCTSLTTISFGSGISQINYNSSYPPFGKCTSLKKIIIRDISAWCRVSGFNSSNHPLSDRQIYSDESTPITDLVIPDGVASIEQYTFYGCTGIKTVNVSNSVQIISASAFASCSNLSKLILGKTVQEIGGSGFSGCAKLDTVISYRTVPPTLYDDKNSSNPVFNNKNRILFVPKGCVSSYKATKWSGFSKIMEFSSVTLDKHGITLNAGETSQITPTVYPNNESEYLIIWQSSNEEIITVDEKGLVKAHKAGKATITATLKTFVDAVDKCDITVMQPVEGITLDQTSIIIEEFGEMVKLNATILPEDASNKSISWSSSNPAVCTVSANGTVIAVGNGTATVIATTVDGGIPATCVVNVKDYFCDVNRDGVVDVADIAVIIDKMAGRARLLNETEE